MRPPASTRYTGFRLFFSCVTDFSLSASAEVSKAQQKQIIYTDAANESLIAAGDRLDRIARYTEY